MHVELFSSFVGSCHGCFKVTDGGGHLMHACQIQVEFRQPRSTAAGCLLMTADAD